MWLAYIFQTPVCLWHPAVKIKVVLLLKRRCFKIGVLWGLLYCEWEAATCFPAFKANIFFSPLFWLFHYISTISAAVSKDCLVSYYSSFQKCQRIRYADWFSKCRFSFFLKTKTILLINLAEIEYSRCRFCWGFFLISHIIIFVSANTPLSMSSWGIK